METSEIIQYAAKCYFWIFIFWMIILIIFSFTKDYKINYENAIKNGTLNYSALETIIRWSLFFLSIKLM